MNSEWKKFLLQWLLPVAIFVVIGVFVTAGFSASIKQEGVQNYQNKIETTTKEQAESISASILKLEAVAEAMIDVIHTNNLAGFGAADVLGPMIEYSDAYMALLIDEGGKATNDQGRSFGASSLSYYNNLKGLSHKGLAYIYDDEIVGNPAFIIKMKIDEGSDRFVLLYYSIDADAVKELTGVGHDGESASACVITDLQGTIITPVNMPEEYESGTIFWSDLGAGNNASTIKRVRSKVQTRSSGSFEANISGKSCIVAYTPIPNANLMLMVSYDRALINKAENTKIASSTKRLTYTIALVVVFLIVVTIINIIDIISGSKVKDELRDKADTDQLTGLRNKIATERDIKEYMAENPNSLGVMFLIDIDNFKKINDTMGHAFGDEVLRELGKNIGINFRVSDIIGRTGGDEFMVFLKSLKEDANTLREAQKLIYFFRHFQVGDYVKYSVTASIGAAVFPDHGSDFETLYKAADAAVYKSKKRGKNQLSFYDDRDRTPEEIAEADAHLIDIERKDETPIES